jgi:probable H4MPT-linked C1 transfer pathway protein
MSKRLALDIGGANLKASHGAGETHVLPFEVWKRPDDLTAMLARLGALFPPADRIAITMTAELCDCYETKADGVREIVRSATLAFDGLPIRVWTIEGGFRSVEEILEQPLLAAASNWLALATVAARLVPDGPGALIDIGSTTTDIIALSDGKAVPQGRTDTQRLQSGELIYTGVRRTPVCTLAQTLPYRGKPTGLAAELFATTLDVYLTLGDIPPDPHDESTADGRPMTLDAARDRLARVVGTDRELFTQDDANQLARAADDALLDRLESAARRVLAVRPRNAVLSGAGTFLAERLADRVLEPGGTIIRLDDAWGPLHSNAACAYALLRLAGEEEEDA